MTDQNHKPLGIICLSGGMDSCVTAAIACCEVIPAFLHVSYGQRTREREKKAFDDLANYYNVPKERRLHVAIDYLKKIGGSALTDPGIAVPSHEKITQSLPGELPVTYVPFRNTHILSIAVSWAEVIKARFIYMGAVAEDSAGYPDCRPEYFEAFNNLISVGSSLENRLIVKTPLINLSKAEIVKRGMELDAPLHLSWSCYKNSDKACGKCDSCLRRKRAFEMAGYTDPISYKNPS